MKLPKFKRGIYQHFKNKKFYEVIGVAFHTETKEFLVVYKALYKSEYPLFVRPYKIFFEKAKDLETKKLVPRFKYLRTKK